MSEFPLPVFSYAYGGPLCQAALRSIPEDFRVDEELPFTLSGEGEHLFVKIRKRNTNTEWALKQLARYCDIHARDIGYAGLKDRNAVTTQWFSIHLPGKPDPDWKDFNTDDWQIMESIRHNRKLKTGALKNNHFRITLRNLEVETSKIQQRLECIRLQGVPNYYGEQRFGRDGENLGKADAMFQGKLREKNHHRRGMYLSAARSWMFNLVLSHRVEARNWDHAISGECFILNGSHSYFCSNEITDDIIHRLGERDIHTSGPLWGRGEIPVTGICKDLELSVLGEMQSWKTGLEKAGLRQERRALRLVAENLDWEIVDDSCVELAFSLSPGCYATSVIRELVSW